MRGYVISACLVGSELCIRDSSKARGEEVKQKPENWMGGMLKGGSTLKVNNMEIPIKTSEVENMMRLIKNNKGSRFFK